MRISQNLHPSLASVISFNARIALKEKLILLSIDLFMCPAQDSENPQDKIQQDRKEPHACVLTLASKVSQHCHVLSAPDQLLKQKTLSLLPHFCLPDHMQIHLLVIHNPEQCWEEDVWKGSQSSAYLAQNRPVCVIWISFLKHTSSTPKTRLITKM